MNKFVKYRLRQGLAECIGGAPVRKITFLLTVISTCAAAATASAAKSESLNFKPQFVFKDRNGKTVSAPLVDDSQKRKLVYPAAKVDPSVNPTLMRAATIAQERAHAHSKSRCWHYVKEALLASGAVDSRPKTALAKQAADELVNNYGFKKLSDPRSFQSSARLGPGLQRPGRCRPCRDSDEKRLRERFPLAHAVQASVDRRLRQALASA